MHVAHTAVWVSNLGESAAFYEDVLGLAFLREFTTDDGVVNYYVGTDDGGAIQFKYDPAGERSVEPSGIDHLALAVDDVDATFDRVIAESGCAVHLEPTTFEMADRRAAFVFDPDGYVVEFVGPI